MEYKHHGDELVPRQQRFGQYTRSLMKALDVPVMPEEPSQLPSKGPLMRSWWRRSGLLLIVTRAGCGRNDSAVEVGGGARRSESVPDYVTMGVPVARGGAVR